MNNADLPAMPLSGDAYEEIGGSNFYEAGMGLTKREYFAAMAMQGLLSVKGYDLGLEYCAVKSVLVADALLAELDKEAT